MSLEHVRGMLQRGEVLPSDYAAGPGLSTWTMISNVPALAHPVAAGALFEPVSHHVGAARPLTPEAGGGGAPAPEAAPGFAADFGAGQPSEPQSSWWRERVKALGVIGFGILAILFNVGTIYLNGTFFPEVVAIGGGCLCFGGWQVIFGDDKDDYTMKQVKWKTVGQIAAGAIGAGIGLWISILIME